MEEKKIPPMEKAYFKTNTLKSIYSTCPAKMTNGHIGWTLGSLSSDVLERRTSTGSEVFFLL